ncbi:hypothetical protein BH09PSE4_BH09PSE4_19000 [soil metagenome]
MTTLSKVEATLSDLVPGLGWLRLALKHTPWILSGVLAIAAAGFAIATFATRARLANVRLEHRTELAETKAADALAQAKNAQRVTNALDGFVARTAAIGPLLNQSRSEMNDYAQTDAGRAPGLNAERVRGIEGLDATLFPPGSAESRAGSVRADAGAPSG